MGCGGPLRDSQSSSKMIEDVRPPIKRTSKMRQIPYIVERPFTFSTERPRAAYQELSQRIKNAKLAVDILKRVDFSSFTDQLEKYGEVKTEFRMLRHKRLE